MLDTPAAIRSSSGLPPLAAIRGTVAFEHVSYRYQAGQVALCDVSYVVPAGATVALVGPTGAGKTTALGLLYRAHDPSDGRITLDGGRLVEQGKYDELLRRDGLFAPLDRQGRFKADADCRLDKSL